MKAIKKFSKAVAVMTVVSLTAAAPLSAFAAVIEGGGDDGGAYTVVFTPENVKDEISNDCAQSGLIIKDLTGKNEQTGKEDIIEKANAKVEINGDINITDKNIADRNDPDDPSVLNDAKSKNVHGVIADSHSDKEETGGLGKADITVNGSINVDTTNNSDSKNLTIGVCSAEFIEPDIDVNGDINVKSNTEGDGIVGASVKNDTDVSGSINVEAKDHAYGVNLFSGNSNITVGKDITTTSSKEAIGILVSDWEDFENVKEHETQSIVKINGDITSNGEKNGVGIWASEVAGNISITIDGDVKASTSAIQAYYNAGKVDIISTGTISSGDAAIVVATSKNFAIGNNDEHEGIEDAYTTVEVEALPNITVWKIESDSNELVHTFDVSYVYDTDENGKLKYDPNTNWYVVDDEATEEEENGSLKDKVLSSINYIIKGSVLENGNDTQNGKIVLKGASGSVTVGDKTYDTAHQDENLTINVETVPGYKYSLSNGDALLTANADGSYTLKVPAGGGVDLKAVLEKIEEQKTSTDTNTNTDNKTNTMLISTGIRNSESSHLAGSSSGSGSGSRAVSSTSALAETPGAWAKDANNNWIYINNGYTYTNTWIVSKNRWYYLDNNGNPVSNWQTVLNKQYYFSAEDTSVHPFGSLYVSALTPDGIYVDANGSKAS